MHINRPFWFVVAASILLMSLTLVLCFQPGSRKPPNDGPYLTEIYSRAWSELDRDRSQSVGVAIELAIQGMLKDEFGEPEQLRGLVLYYNPDSAAWHDGSDEAGPVVLLLASVPSVSLGQSGYPAVLSNGTAKLLDKNAALGQHERLRLLSPSRGAVGEPSK